MHFVVSRFEYNISLSEGSIFTADIPFLKPYCFVTSMFLVCRYLLNLLCIDFMNTLEKPLIMIQACNLLY